MLDPVLRPVKDRVLFPLARAAAARLAPNTVTLLGLLLGLAAAALLLLPSYPLALLAWWANRLMDGIDGLVARSLGRSSDLGGYVDILGDFVVYAAVPIALVAGRPHHPAASLALSLMLASFYVNAASWMYLAALLEKRAGGAAARGEVTSVTMPAGLVGGAETIVLYTLFILFPGNLPAWFLLTAALTTATVVQRLLWASRNL